MRVLTTSVGTRIVEAARFPRPDARSCEAGEPRPKSPSRTKALLVWYTAKKSAEEGTCPALG